MELVFVYALTVTGDVSVSGKAQLGPLTVTGDASVSGKAQLGPLTVTGDASVSGKAQLGPLTVTGDASVSGKAQFGPLTVTGNASISGQAQLGSLVIGSLQLGGFTDADKDEWPNVVWYRDTGKNWDEGLIKHSSTRGKFGRAGFGIHFDQAREFGLWSSGWDPLFAVEGGTGNVYFKGNIRAGNSGLYFSKTDHDHTGIGNTAGWAAIENAKNYDALMILGRAGTDKGRKVRLWDYLEVLGTFVNNSDEGMKTDVEELHYGLDEILCLRPVSFNWKDIPNVHKSLGLVAQEVQPHIREVVYEEKDSTLGNRFSVAYINLIPVLINAIKELANRLGELEKNAVANSAPSIGMG